MLKNVQALRALAATLVIFVHLQYILNAIGLRSFGYGGVDLFFTISGFIMVYTTKFKRQSSSYFFIHRLIRIAPLYWIMTIIVFFMAHWLPKLLQTPTGSWLDLLKSILFIPFRRSDGRLEPVFFLGWTLNLEIFFYAVFAIFLRVPRFWIGVCGVVLFFFALPFVGYIVRPGADVARFYINPIVSEFALGCIIGSLEFGKTSRWQLALCAALAPLTIVMIALSGTILNNTPRIVSAGLPAAILLLSAIKLEAGGFQVSNTAVLAVGDASYSLYLTHPFIVVLMSRLLGRREYNVLIEFGVLAIVLLACVVFAFYFFVFVEKPLTRALRRTADRRLFRAGGRSASAQRATPLSAR